MKNILKKYAVLVVVALLIEVLIGWIVKPSKENKQALVFHIFD